MRSRRRRRRGRRDVSWRRLGNTWMRIGMRLRFFHWRGRGWRGEVRRLLFKLLSTRRRDALVVIVQRRCLDGRWRLVIWLRILIDARPRKIILPGRHGWGSSGCQSSLIRLRILGVHRARELVLSRYSWVRRGIVSVVRGGTRMRRISRRYPRPVVLLASCPATPGLSG